MTIEVRFFASLREQVGKAATELEAGNGLTVLEVWQQATDNSELAANILTAVNMEYVDRDRQVVDGDEVAFFPPVTGG